MDATCQVWKGRRCRLRAPDHDWADTMRHAYRLILLLTCRRRREVAAPAARPVRYAQRSKELTHVMRLQKSKGFLARCKQGHMYQRLARAWNRKAALRHGERAFDPLEGPTRLASGHKRKLNKHRWHFTSSIEHANRCIGGREHSGRAGECGGLPVGLWNA